MKKQYITIPLISLLLTACGQTPEERCNNKIEAYGFSKQFVRESLNNPSSADIPYSNASGVSVTPLGNCTFRIKSYVRGQNAFGATVKQDYTITMQYRKSADNWYRISPVSFF